MKLPSDIGPVHFVGIGGIGMSGIAEVLLNLGYTVQGSDASDSANVKRLRDKGAQGCGRPRRRQSRRCGGRGGVDRHQARQSRAHGGAGAAAAGGAPRRDAGRADAAQELRRHRRHPRQDHDHLAGGGAARSRQLRSHRHQRRHHRGLRHQCAARRRRLDGGGGGRIRRHVPEAAGRHRHRHQCRPRASRPLQDLRGGAGGVPRLRRERAVLRLCGDVHRPPGGAAAGRADHRPPRHHLWREPAGRRAARRSRPCRRPVALLDRVPRSRRRDHARDQVAHLADARPPQCAQRDGGGRGGARARHFRRHDPQGAAELRRGAAALHPHRHLERRRRSSTITATIRSRSPPCCAPRAN